MVTNQWPVKNGARLVNYVLSEKSHRDEVQRNLYVTTLNLIPSKDNDANDYLDQFRSEWIRARERHEVQMRHLIFSSSRKEYSVSEENAFEFAQVVRKYIKEYYPNRKAIIGVQADGSGFYVDSNDEIVRHKNGNAVRSEKTAKKIAGDNVRKEYVLHAHVALSDCDMDDTKGVETEKTGFRFLSRTFDEFFEKETGIEIDYGVKRGRASYLSGKLQEEGIYEDGTYVSYKDDIADRIDQCIGASSSMEEFYDKLPRFGLKLKANKNGSVFHTHRTKGDYVTFELVDQSRTRDGQRFSKDAEVNGELRKTGSLVKCSVRSFNFDKEGYGLNEIAQRIASGETYEPTIKKKKSVGDYMLMISGSSDYSFLDDVNKENTNYWAQMAARVDEPEEPEEEKKEKPHRNPINDVRTRRSGERSGITEAVENTDDIKSVPTDVTEEPQEETREEIDTGAIKIAMQTGESVLETEKKEKESVDSGFGIK